MNYKLVEMCVHGLGVSQKAIILLLGLAQQTLAEQWRRPALIVGLRKQNPCRGNNRRNCSLNRKKIVVLTISFDVSKLGLNEIVKKYSALL